MDDNMGLVVVYGKEDILTDCKYCRRTKRKGFLGDGIAHGYECLLRMEKRNCNRCRYCYFGRHHERHTYR